MSQPEVEDESTRGRAWWSPKVNRELLNDTYKMIGVNKETD
jgi:hypothetical protein